MPPAVVFTPKVKGVLEHTETGVVGETVFTETVAGVEVLDGQVPFCITARYFVVCVKFE